MGTDVGVDMDMDMGIGKDMGVYLDIDMDMDMDRDIDMSLYTGRCHTSHEYPDKLNPRAAAVANRIFMIFVVC